MMWGINKSNFEISKEINTMETVEMLREFENFGESTSM
jgi:hypothetical protein